MIIRNPYSVWRPGVPIVLALALLSSSVCWGQTANDNSLSFVPDSVAFYSASFRGKEQWDRFTNSNAYRKLTEIPLIQLAGLQVRNQWNNSDEGLGQLRVILEMEEVKPFVRLVGDAVSHEVFVYGDDSVAQWLKQLNRINSIQTRLQLQMAREGQTNDPEAMTSQLFDELIKTLDDYPTPKLVMGFRVTKKDLATRQLARAEQLLREALVDEPELLAGLQRQTLDGGEYLTFTASGKMIPWEQLRQDVDDAQAQEMLDKVREKLQSRSVVITVGLRGDYLLLAMGPTLDETIEMTTADRLVDRAEMARVKAAMEKPLTSVGYVSEEFMKAVSNPGGQIDDLVAAAELGIAQVDIADEVKEQIRADVKGFVADLKTQIPEPGAVVTYSYLTDFGVEEYQQSWGAKLHLDGSQPLNILEHVGGAPLMVFALRSRSRGESYEMLSKWAAKGWQYVDMFDDQLELDDAQRELWQRYSKRILAMATEFDKITREYYLPALRDGQTAVVLNAQVTSKQWHAAMPVATEPLPLPEFSLVRSVSDAARLRQALLKYWALGGDTLLVVQDIVRENEQSLRDASDEQADALIDAVLAFKWPIPQIKLTEHGELFQLPIPAAAGLDVQLLPTLGITDDAMVASITESTVLRLLKKEPLRIERWSVASRPLAAASFWDISGTLEMTKPWLSYGFDEVASQTGQPIVSTFLPQVLSLVEIAQAVKSVQSTTTFEDGSWILHRQWHYEDVAP